MDPFLESSRHFSGLHGALIVNAMGALNRSLPPDYFATIGERIWVEATDGQREPDFDVIRTGRPPADGAGETAATAIAVGAAPVVLTVPLTHQRQQFLEVMRREDDEERLVAVFEVLSPANKKPGPGRDQYLAKQREVTDAMHHLIEIDLLRAGRPTTLLPTDWSPAGGVGFDYHCCVTRSVWNRRFEIYPVRLRDRLPVVSVPLVGGDEPVPLDLQAVFDAAYEDGPYRKRVNYGNLAAIAPPLSPEDAAWAAEVVRG